MTTDNKTLADVQPGGMVRLGDQAERAWFEAWAEPRKHTLTRWGDSPGDVKPLFVSEVPGNYISPAAQAAWEAWQYLSAQPSPGGQGDARRQWLEIRGLAAAIVKNLQAFADSPHKAAWCGALDDSLLFADQIEKAAAAAYEADLERRRMA